MSGRIPILFLSVKSFRKFNRHGRKRQLTDDLFQNFLLHILLKIGLAKKPAKSLFSATMEENWLSSL